MISVIVPVYNRGDLVQDTIESVLNQSYTEFSLIVVDDASTDDTPETINSYNDPRIEHIQFDKNRGANAARNRGIQESDTKYVSFLDSDDRFTEDHLRTVVQYLNNAEDSVGGVYTAQNRYKKGKLTAMDSAQIRITSPNQVIKDYPANGFSAFTFRREVFDHVGYLDEDLPAYQDRDFLVRLLQQYRLDPISEPLVNYRVHDDRISSDPDRKLLALDRFESKYEELIDDSEASYIHYSRGYLYAEKKNMLAARSEFLAAVKIRPTSVRYITALLSTFFGYSGFRSTDKIKKILNTI